jgi:hypothetical protein
MKWITEQEIIDARTPNGGWTKKTLAAWGIPWPKRGNPPTGWKEVILQYGVPYAEALHRKKGQECDDAMARDRTGDEAWKQKK